MDFDFTDNSGNGFTVEAEKSYGIYATASDDEGISGGRLTPGRAREIAQALNACADYMENQ